MVFKLLKRLFVGGPTATVVEEDAPVDVVPRVELPEPVEPVVSVGGFNFMSGPPLASPPVVDGVFEASGGLDGTIALGAQSLSTTPRTGRLAKMGLDLVYVPSLREHLLLYRLAAEEAERDDPTAALARWRVIVEGTPLDTYAWERVASLAQSIGQPEFALSAWRQLLAVDPLHTAALAAVAASSSTEPQPVTDSES